MVPFQLGFKRSSGSCWGVPRSGRCVATVQPCFILLEANVSAGHTRKPPRSGDRGGLALLHYESRSRSMRDSNSTTASAFSNPTVTDAPKSATRPKSRHHSACTVARRGNFGTTPSGAWVAPPWDPKAWRCRVIGSFLANKKSTASIVARVSGPFEWSSRDTNS